jgi:hypothetical protein
MPSFDASHQILVIAKAKRNRGPVAAAMPTISRMARVGRPRSKLLGGGVCGITMILLITIEITLFPNQRLDFRIF